MKLNIKGSFLEASSPIIMGILNVTPDSFYSNSRCFSDATILKRADEIVEQGGKIIDIGGYSTRPNHDETMEKDEIARITTAINLIKKRHPDVIISIDTFRTNVAKIAVTDFEADIINDISGGYDPAMFETIATLNIPYILTHCVGTPQNMHNTPHYSAFKKEIFTYFASRINRLRLMGANNIIIDPGFGVSKSLEQNYELLNQLELFSIFKRPLLVGVSRKRMAWQFLETSPEDCLNGTSILHTIALQKGANILRVHDVKEAVEAVKIANKLKECSSAQHNTSYTYI